MTITGATPQLVYEADRVRYIILSNTGSNPLSIGFDYSTAATGDGFSLAAGGTTTQFQINPGQKIFASAPSGASSITVLAT